MSDRGQESPHDERLPGDRLLRETREVCGEWPTGEAVDIDDAVGLLQDGDELLVGAE